MAVRHVVSFRFKEDTTDEQKSTMVWALRGMAGTEGLKDLIQAVTVGEDIGITHPAGPNADVMAIVDFASKEDYETYAKHPEHVKVITEFIKPIIEQRYAIQFHI